MDTPAEVATERLKDNPPAVVVRGKATSFLQEIVSGRHHLRSDEPVSAGGEDRVAERAVGEEMPRQDRMIICSRPLAHAHR